ncbi:DUF397 domain-containing protein [Streptomyces sp. NPDC003023]|uniref:DUF397 domain-containing protein n=1 Tax=Streptomyces sp. NPDC003023 TaxID=3364675 RepID=UPI00369F09A6
MSSDHATGPVDLTWFKSSRSGPEGGDCVEVAVAQEAVRVRDSKEPARAHLTVGAAHWTTFIGFAAR